MHSRVAGLLAALVIVALAGVAWFTIAQDRKEHLGKGAGSKEAKDRQSQLEAMIQEFINAQQQAAKAMQAAPTEEARKRAQDKLPQEKDYLPRVHELIAGNAADDVAAEALAFAVFGLQ